MAPKRSWIRNKLGHPLCWFDLKGRSPPPPLGRKTKKVKGAGDLNLASGREDERATLSNTTTHVFSRFKNDSRQRSFERRGDRQHNGRPAGPRLDRGTSVISGGQAPRHATNWEQFAALFVRRSNATEGKSARKARPSKREARGAEQRVGRSKRDFPRAPNVFLDSFPGPRAPFPGGAPSHSGFLPKPFFGQIRTSLLSAAYSILEWEQRRERCAAEVDFGLWKSETDATQIRTAEGRDASSLGEEAERKSLGLVPAHKWTQWRARRVRIRARFSQPKNLSTIPARQFV